MSTTVHPMVDVLTISGPSTIMEGVKRYRLLVDLHPYTCSSCLQLDSFIASSDSGESPEPGSPDQFIERTEHHYMSMKSW